MLETFTTGAHEALLDPLEGAGIVVAPLASTDVRLGGPEGLNAADWTSLVRRLLKAGWTFLEDEWEDVAVIARLADGRRVHALHPTHADSLTMEEGEVYALTLARLLSTFSDVA